MNIITYASYMCGYLFSYISILFVEGMNTKF